MKKLIIRSLFIVSICAISQPSNYYDSCLGLNGLELRQELHNIIDDHTSWSYSITKDILRNSDKDPNNPNNIILVYSGNSIDSYDFASNLEPDFWSREHVWPKSHGDFSLGDPYEVPLYSDAHNLKPADLTMNTVRGDKDFDNGGEVVLNGVVETDCFDTEQTFEPRDEVKGDIARIILYMDVRYEGGQNEPDLVPISSQTSPPSPQIGILSTLLEWHEMDPPDAFEKRRNDVIYDWQGNRNPFIDYPEFANYIYNDVMLNTLEISNVSAPSPITPNEGFSISATVTSNLNCCPIESVVINYGNSWYEMDNSLDMDFEGNWSAYISGQADNTMFCYSITATDSEGNSNVFFGSQMIPMLPFDGILTPISEIQGESEYSPYEGQSVNTTGIVTGAFANSFYIQDSSNPWSGIYIYSGNALPSMGDSVIVQGEISEFCWNGSPCDCSQCGGAGVTEFFSPDTIRIISNNIPIPEPILVSSGEALTEQYEGVLVRIENAECISMPSGYGIWNVDDGSGEASIHNTPDGYEFDPTIGETYNITGIVTSTFNEWKIDLRIPSDVESGPDTSPPFVTSHSCFQVGSNYYIYLYFNEAINPNIVNNDNFLITNATLVNSSLDMFDPTKLVLTLNNVISTSMGLIMFEVEDMLGNSSTNLTYSINNCEWNFNINEQPSNITIFPNPNNGNFQIELLEPSRIKIMNHLGQMVWDKNLKNGISKASLHNKGLYFIEVQNNNHIIPLLVY